MTALEQPTSWLEQQLSGRPLTVLVFFRGGWCPFCQGYLREMNTAFLQAVRGKGGELIGVTSQSAEAAEAAHSEWGLGYPVVSDPSNALARKFDVAITPKAQTPLADHPTEYSDGMAQPAVIALDGSGNVLFRWAIDPNEMNLGGASDRPLPEDIWAVIDAALQGKTLELTGDRKLDPQFLAEHYPEAHAAFQAWVASQS